MYTWHSVTALYMIEILWSQPSGDLLPNIIMQTYTTRHTICHLLLRHQKPFRVMMRRGAGSGPKLVTPDMGSLGGGIPSNPIENGHRNSGFTHWKWWICPSFFVCLPEGKEFRGFHRNIEIPWDFQVELKFDVLGNVRWFLIWKGKFV